MSRGWMYAIMRRETRLRSPWTTRVVGVVRGVCERPRWCLTAALSTAALACSFATPGFGTDPIEASSSSTTTGSTGDITATGGLSSGGVAEPVCGDGQIDPGEQCDNASGNGDAGLCTAACKHAVCGDGLVSPLEQCDDTNDVDDDGCNNECRHDTCGDGQPGPGEACDNGAGNSDRGLCTTACQLAKCGDGLVSPLEQCDDGNAVDGDLCSNACVLETCGDGQVDAGEQCDDGNEVNDDLCTTSCKGATCGDGFVQVGEQCDDGDSVNDDACTTACAPPACGDGFVQTGEECDGETPGVDLCTADCLALQVNQFVFVSSGAIPEYKDENNPNKPPTEGATAATQSACRGFTAPADPNYPYVHDIEFSLTLSHPRVGELVLYLRNPEGKWLIVSNRPGFAEPDGGSNMAGGNEANLSMWAPLVFLQGSKVAGEMLGEGLLSDQTACLDDGQCEYAPNRGASTTSLQSFDDFVGKPAVGAGNWSLCVQDQVPNGSKGTFLGASVTMLRRQQP